jgi:hypothetical protein
MSSVKALRGGGKRRAVGIGSRHTAPVSGCGGKATDADIFKVGIDHGGIVAGHGAASLVYPVSLFPVPLLDSSEKASVIPGKRF